MLDDVDLLVCGAGPVGCVVAERAANVLGWKVLIPVTLVWIGVEMVMAVYHIGPWARPWYQ